MAHIARLNSNNIVVQVLSAPDNIDEIAISNATGQKWKQTSYNTYANKHLLGGNPFRKNFAALGYKYNGTKNAFIAPKPFDSWILNSNTCVWESPVEKPNGKCVCEWDEQNQEWINCLALPI
jgi:hypothetical protein|tara:strand:+ start:1335 stop:1700 length:366 start_codon:yes stop_codon:yes gene_type:complete